MKKRFKHRKQLKKGLEAMGITRFTNLEVVEVKGTNRQAYQLVNPLRRIMKVLLSLDEQAQANRVSLMRAQAETFEQQRNEDNKLLENG
jgi:hypothetical protein